jgi:hypothetical protein
MMSKRPLPSSWRIIENGRDAIERASAQGQAQRRRQPAADTKHRRNEILRGLGRCLPKLQRSDDVRWLAQQFDREHIDALVHWTAIFEAYGDGWIALHFARRKPRIGWPFMAKMIGRLALLALRRWRRGYGRAGGPLVAFIFDCLAPIVGDAMPSHETLLRRLERALPKAPPRRRKRRRKQRRPR